MNTKTVGIIDDASIMVRRKLFSDISLDLDSLRSRGSGRKFFKCLYSSHSKENFLEVFAKCLSKLRIPNSDVLQYSNT
jgi:hypothetical protein